MGASLLDFNQETPSFNFDVVIVGAGIAGLYCALEMPEHVRIALITKDSLSDCNSELAQGGIAVTLRNGDFEAHIQDTLKAGSFFNDETAVRDMILEGYEHIDRLLALDVPFDMDPYGNLAVTKEGGHTQRRVVHYKDKTGSAIMEALRLHLKRASNITVFENTQAVDILKSSDHQEVYGLIGLEGNKTLVFHTAHVVLATGGVGHLYRHTTNAQSISGDGIAMALRAGAAVKDMEMIQFHPTALYVEGAQRHSLISEAVRGEGGILRNAVGEAFMEDRHPQKDLAPRDVVSREIYKEMLKYHSKSVYLDCRHLDPDYLKGRFPTIYETCLQNNIDMCVDLIPVVPVEHYSMGGVQTDRQGRTNVAGLYAIGEVACTGVHGANRLASNSLLEGLVFASRTARLLADLVAKEGSVNQDKPPYVAIVPDLEQLDEAFAAKLYQEIRTILSDVANIYRKPEHLKKGNSDLLVIGEALRAKQVTGVNGIRAMNSYLVAKEVLKGALSRSQSLGAHQIEEVPNT